MKPQEVMVQAVVRATPDPTSGVAGKRMGEHAAGCLEGIETGRFPRHGLPEAGKFATLAALDNTADAEVKHAI